MKTELLKKVALTNFLILIFCLGINAGTYEKKTFTAESLCNDSPVIDGQLEDKCWEEAKWDNSFVQYRPVEGDAPGQETQYAMLYDNDFIYIGVKALDTAPDSIVKRLTRRDQTDGDYIMVQFDSYHNKQTAFCFKVSAAGVKSDYFISNDGENADINWDPIWHVKTSLNDAGWFAEMKIPISQLRFNPEENNTWGFQAQRLIYRNDETVLWQPIARDASGWVNNLGLLTGLKDIKSKKTFDIIPYAVTSAESFESQAGNPFVTGSNYGINAGLDGKVGITNYFTLDFTINPDFGQVEADPSQVNLTAFETFFSEKRPFFIEGSNLFNYRLGFGDGELGNENLFYSRRIGRSPQYYYAPGENEYINAPEHTPIIGALKLTGRTNNGLSLGIMQSTTASQYAEIDNLGDRSKILTEPLTSYFTARAVQELDEGNTSIGIIGTAVNRDINENHLDFLHTSAYTAGLDLKQYFADRSYMLVSTAYMSHVMGSKEAISRTQLSPTRYFQRPDAKHLDFDPNKTSLTGAGGSLQLWKISGKLRIVGAVLAKSPGLETNDIGYLRETDNVTQVLWAGYRINEPIGILRSININANQWLFYTLGGEKKNFGGNINFWMQFNNYWNLSAGFNISDDQLSTTMLRGGPSYLLPGNINPWLRISTDERKKISISTTSSYMNGFEDYRVSYNNNVGITYRPLNTLHITLSPGYYKNNSEVQYVTTTTSDDNKIYVLGELEQSVTSLSLRINYTITPELSLQFWGQPFIASGSYSNFKKSTDTKAESFNNRYYEYTDSEIAFNETTNSYEVFESGNEEPDYKFRNPDFNVKEFLSNLVLRWEYQPGSTLFFVWSQTRDHYAMDGNFNIQHDANQLFSDTPYNVFMLKFSYRIGV